MRGGIDSSADSVILRDMANRKKAAAPSKSAEQVKFLETFREMVGPEEIIEAGCRLGAIKRQRKVDLPALVQATIAAMLPTPGVRTTVLANYLSLTGEGLAPSSFYDRFTLEYASLMREVAQRAIEGVRKVAPDDRSLADYGVLLSKFTDIQVADSTSHLLKKLARHWAPSTSKVKPAGIKWHALVSLKDGLPVADRLTEQRMHDNVGLPDEALAPGTLTLFDLGYVDVERFIAAIERRAHFLTRLKTNHNPIILRVHVGKGDRVRARGMRLEEALTQGVLLDEGGAIDLDVQLDSAGRSVKARVVAELAPDGEFHWYLTSVERDVLSVDDVVETYRLRWYIELIFKQLKSGAGLKAILASRPWAVAALVYAKVIVLCLARLLELSIEQKQGRHATTQLALVLTLTRCAPLLLSAIYMQRGVTFEQLEERLMLIATITARSRNQRRERVKRQREQAIGGSST